MSSTSSHLRSGWSLQTIMKLEQSPGKTETNSFVFRPTACSSMLFVRQLLWWESKVCMWLDIPEASWSLETDGRCATLLKHFSANALQEICGERVLQRFGHTTLPPEDKSLEAGKEMWRRQQRHISPIFTSFCLYLFCRLSAALLSALRHPWRQKTCDGQSQRDSQNLRSLIFSHTKSAFEAEGFVRWRIKDDGDLEEAIVFLLFFFAIPSVSGNCFQGNKGIVWEWMVQLSSFAV